MALPWAYRPYTPVKPSGQADQNALYRMLAMNAAAGTQPAPPLQTTPVLGVPPYDTSFGSQPGVGISGPAAGSGDLPGPNVPGGPPGGNPTQSPAAGGSSSPSSGGNNGGGGYNFSLGFEGDPILARIRAANARNIADAEASALAARKQRLIGYGYDPALAALYPDATTRQASQQNPFSTLAQLLFNHGIRGDQLTDALNKANLFYSGERIKQTGLEGRQYTLEQAQAQGALQNLLDQISQSVLNAKLSAQQTELQGESDAYDRMIQFALQYGGFGGNGTGGGGGSGGGGSGTGGAPKPGQPGANGNNNLPYDYLKPDGTMGFGPPPAGWVQTGTFTDPDDGITRPIYGPGGSSSSGGSTSGSGSAPAPAKPSKPKQ